MDNELADLNKLYDAYLASMKGSAWKEEPQKFEMNFLSEIVQLKKELESREYRTSRGVEFTLNERGKTRRIHGGRMRDRVVRHVLCDTELGPKLQKFLIYNNGASQRGKGLTFARDQFRKDLHNYWLKYRTNEGYIAFVDLSKFYDNIRHDKVKELVYPHISDDARWLMDEVLSTFEVDVSYLSDEEYAECLNRKFDSVAYYLNIPETARTGEKRMKKSVDIGDQVSQNIGIYFPTRIDNYVKIVCGCKWYGRYMDDMYIIHPDRSKLEQILNGIRAEAAELGLFINKRKTRIVKLGSTYKYLQNKYTLTDTGKVIIRINPKSVTRERRKIKAYKRLTEAGTMTYQDAEQAVKSWMADHAGLMSKDQIRHMKDLYFESFMEELRWKKQRSFSRTGRASKQR